MELVRPSTEHLASYTDALRRGWSPSTTRPEVGAEELQLAEADPAQFLSSMDDPDGTAPAITLPDGSTVRRVPSRRLWLWNGSFLGSISLRWQQGTAELPPHCLGHVGYTVVPWQRLHGYATAALRELLPHAARTGLPHLDLVTDLDNVASQRVILANGGVLIRTFELPIAYGSGPAKLYRIQLRSEGADRCTQAPLAGA